MGSITAYDTAAGRRWRVRYRKADRSQTDKRGFTSKRDAQLYLAGVEVSKSRGEYIDPKAGKRIIGDLGATRLEQRRATLKASTWDSEESAWRVHVQPVWGSTYLVDVRRSDVQAWVARLSRDLSASSVLRAHGILLGILDDALHDRRIPSNPAAGVDLPRKAPAPRHYLSHEQVEQLAIAAGEHGTIVRTLAYTGLRWGELVALRIRHVNFLKRRLSVDENAPTSRGRITVGTPKSHERRTVPFPAFLADELAARCEGKGRESLLFGDGHNHLRTPSSQDGWFSVAVRACQRADEAFPRITPHDLRHTAASLAVSAGAHVKAVQRMLGHKSAAMTLDTYADLFDDDLDAISDALDQARAAASVGKVWANGPA